MGDSGGPLATLTDWSPRLFLVAAGLMTVVAGLFAAEVATGRDLAPYLGTFAPAGFFAAFLALLGRYPALRERAPRLARGGAVVLVIGLAGAVVLVGGHLGQIAGLYAEQPAWVGAANLPLLGAVLLGFGAFGVGSLLTGAHSTTVALLMLWPAVVFGLAIIVVATFVLGLTLPHWIHVGHSASEVLVYGALGYQLRSDGTAVTRTVTGSDSPT